MVHDQGPWALGWRGRIVMSKEVARPVMPNARRFARVASTLVCAALLAAACGGDTAQPAGFEVTSEVVSHETTQEMLVFAPDSEGPWPVVWAVHGIGGTGQDMAQFSSRLAREGFVVFAPTYRTDLNTQQGTLDALLDAECGYRFARTIAADYGGDLDQPVTFVGWSLGASVVLEGGLTEEIDPSQQIVKCFTEVPRADVIVAISGCHYEFEGAQFDFDQTGWENGDADIVLLAGHEDTICAAWQSEDAAAELRSAGYEVELVMLEGADHFAPIFHELVDGDLVVVPDDQAGEQAVELIVDAVAARQASS